MKPKQKATMLIRNVDAEIKRHFKAYCAKRDIPMNKMIERLMKAGIQSDPKKRRI